MGMSARAHLAYGYDLGSSEEFLAAERGEYGEPKLPWLAEGDQVGDDEYEGFSEGVEELLLAATGFVDIPWEQRKDYDDNARKAYYDAKNAAERSHGVELDYSGHGDYAGWMFIAQGSSRSVEWSESMVLDLDELNTPRPEWDAKLAAALKVLGITPKQNGPKWLVYPSYG